jgi:MerR family Zn(II)-responsive transcriptional regulator of zntA
LKIIIVGDGKVGFTLAEISDVLAVWVDDKFTAEQKQSALRRKLQQLEEKEAALTELRSRLVNALDKVGQPCVDEF